MRKLFTALTMLLVVAAPLAVEAASIQSSEANAPRSERRESNAPRSREADAPRSDRRESNAPRADREGDAPRTAPLGAPDSVDQGNPAP